MDAPQRQHKPGVWTEEEDALLALWQGRVGNKWSEVAKHIPGKTGQQCAQRWRHRVNPNISREKWTAEEDAKLAELVEEHGNSWAEISRRLPGRTDQQCMGRWRRHLDPSIRRESWQPAEDEQLRELYSEYGSSWSCISKSLTGRTAQQCRARWCQLSNAERPSRSAASRSKAASGASKPAAAAAGEPASSALAAETLLLHAAAGNPRRQSTANTVGTQQQQPPATAPGATPAELCAAAQGGAAGGQARSRGGRSRQRDGSSAAPVGASRRLSAVSEVGAHNPGWSVESAEEEEEEEDESSPEFTVRRTTARTAGRAPGSACPPRSGSAASAASLAAIDAATAAAAMLAAGLPLPAQHVHLAQQHTHLQPPAAAAQQQQQGAAFAPAAAALTGSRLPVPVMVLPDTVLPLKLAPPATIVGPGLPVGPADEDEDSPALTENPGPHAAATADLLSPLRAPLPSAPPLFTPSSSGRKRTAASRIAAFGPALPPLVIPDLQTTTVAKGTPMRPTPGTGGSGPMSLELPSPNVLTLLQSPPPLLDDLFRSPGFGTMLTPPWAKSGGSGGSGKTAGGASGDRRGDAETEDRRLSVARRLDAGPSFGDQQQQQQQQAGLQHAASFDFGLIGSPPKKTRMFSPTDSTLTAATAAAAGGGTPWTVGAGTAAAGGLLLPADSAGGGTSLAMAVQHHLLLASTAKAGPPLGSATAAAADAACGKENSSERRQAAARQARLTAAKPASQPGSGRGGSPGNELTSSSVRMRLHALLENV